MTGFGTPVVYADPGGFSMKDYAYWDYRYTELLLQCWNTQEPGDDLYDLIQNQCDLLKVPIPNISAKEKDSVIRDKTVNEIKEYVSMYMQWTNPKLTELADRFNLQAHHIKIIEFLYIYGCMNDFTSYFEKQSAAGQLFIFTTWAHISKNELVAELRPHSPMGKLGLLEYERFALFDLRHINIRVGLNKYVYNYLEDINNRPLSSFLLKVLEPPYFALETFDMPETTILSAKAALKRHGPAFLLFYGEPGTGKSELSKALSLSCNLIPYSLMTDDVDGSRPLSNLYLSAKLLDSKKEVLIIDEADTLLNSEDVSSAQNGPSTFKAIVNQFLDNATIKIIFITNQTNRIPASVLRRMHIVIGFKPSSIQYRKQMWETNNNVTNLFSSADIDKLAKDFKANPSRIRQVYEICSLLKEECESHERILAVAKDMLSRSQEMLMKDNQKIHHNIDEIDVRLLRLSIDPYVLLDRIKKWYENFSRTHQGLNLLFYGLPGTGKSALAIHIATELQLQPIIKRASDLFSHYVGVTEDRIRDAFKEAENNVLILDEADSFILNREKNERSWERSQTNEFLTQMDDFKGLLIATTNFVKALDGASFRRFPYKIEFYPPTPDQRLSLAHHYFPHITFDTEACFRILNLEGLVPGDFSSVTKRLAFIDTPTTQEIISELELELKSRSHLQPVIGFKV